MRIGIFSDIHGNYEALKAIYDDMQKEQLDEIICLGDVVGIGPNPKECLDFIRTHSIPMVLGNHELYQTRGTFLDGGLDIPEISHQQWVHKTIGQENLEFLNSLPLSMMKQVNQISLLFEHFLIDEEKKQNPFYGFNILNEEKIMTVLTSLPFQYVFIGHEHKPIQIQTKNHVLWDGGSSGCRVDDTTTYTICEINEDVSVIRKYIPYNHQKFVENLKSNNYPNREQLAKTFFHISL